MTRHTVRKTRTSRPISPARRYARAGVLGAGLAGVLAVASPLAAHAHIEPSPSVAQVNGYSVLSFAVGHGCDGSPTTAVSFSIPAEVTHVTPTANPGWVITQQKTGDRTTGVTYTAKEPLPASVRDVFSLSIFVSADAKVGSTISFPIVQSCVAGQTNWNEPPKADGSEPDHPAAEVTLVPAMAEGTVGSAPGMPGMPGMPGATSAPAPAEPGIAMPMTTSASGQGGDQVDVLARILGASGLVVGIAGITYAIAVRRIGSAGRPEASGSSTSPAGTPDN